MICFPDFSFSCTFEIQCFLRIFAIKCLSSSFFIPLMNVWCSQNVYPSVYGRLLGTGWTPPSLQPAFSVPQRRFGAFVCRSCGHYAHDECMVMCILVYDSKLLEINYIYIIIIVFIFVFIVITIHIFIIILIIVDFFGIIIIFNY